MRILLIDDEEFLAKNLCSYLQQQGGIETRHAPTAGEAISIIRENEFDLVILDLHLPDAKGSDLLLKIEEMNPGQAFMIISAYGIPQEIKEKKEINITAYFEKPFDIKELYQKIKDLSHLTNTS